MPETGLACGPWVWDQTTSALRERYSIYLLTLPGFDGRAPQPGVTLESLEKDLLALIESRKLDRPVLVGHSLGGTLSLSFATKHSDVIRGVVDATATAATPSPAASSAMP